MRIQVLGCSGGIGNGAQTTALLVDDDILIDAGTGVADLSLDAMAAIDHVFLTHSHLDHVVSIPFLLDSVGARRAPKPLTVHAQTATLEVLRTHVFNNALWPDFTAIPSRQNPYLRFETLAPGETITLGGRQLRSISVNHTVPAVAYLLGNGRASFGFSGDTCSTDAYWQALNACTDLRHVVIETSFMDEEEALSRLSGHLCPRLLVEELKKLKTTAQVYITHLMPGEEDAIMAQIRNQVPDNPPQALLAGMIFDL